ncbi:hypothetical protein QN362_00330 [Actimicrobium sp. CCC2.4]|uniref:hypothetical protein n=1 Tax=Actimicrobium sp. CCC2.4 TaxID=3048606 RepID=UPI002AC8AF83|nr:hypothetical protein [Actimicrobium sp. CCC2.4]MEB0133771.1 hypothetical protein [Actimicrobium sp. CCC2.4]WPX31314.1 hypothetical protein RHM62_13810 [Actimicrobium sp. CCC2.4]
MFARLALLIFILTPIAAHADPVSFLVAVGSALGASAATAFAVGLAVSQIALTVGMAVYGAAQQRRAARAQRDAYNANLQDRTVTKVAAEAPHVFVLGRARVGSAIVAIFTSGDKDQFKHLVCVHAAHECDGIEEVYIAGKALGTLDAGGNVTHGDYFSGTTETTSQQTRGGSIFLPSNAIASSIVVVMDGNDSGNGSFIEFTKSGNTISFSNPSGANVIASYQYTDGVSRVKVSKHLGGAGDAADAGLMAAVPDKWTSTSVLRGYCYTVITLDLNHPEFQGGIQSVEVLLRGKKLYDVRTDTMTWSQNPALAIYWYLTSEMCGVSQGDIPVAQVIAAANVCDESLTIGERYTMNGTITSDQTQSGVLEKMAQAMAGGIVATTWDMFAGKYIAPVLALDQSDIIGSIAVTPGASDADLFNGVRGQYVGADNSYVATDFGPYQNPAYVIADGRELWTNIDFPFTNYKQRLHNLARIFTEDQRNGYTVKAQFSMKAWAVKIGQRVTLTSPFFGWNAKVFRVTDKSYSPGSPVDLTLKEDAASIWDEADATEPDSTPNTDLQNPFAILPLESIYTTSGSASLLRMGDGTIVSRILLQWPAARTQAVFTSGVIEFEWQQIGTIAWERDTVSGSSLQAYISTVRDGTIYIIRARCRNPYFNTVSNWVYSIHKVVGKTQRPPNVSLFAVSVLADGTRRFTFGTTDQPVDVLSGGSFRIKYRMSGSGTVWASMTALNSGSITGSPFDTNSPPAGTYDFAIVAVDTSQLESATPAFVANAVLGNEPVRYGAATNLLTNSDFVISTGTNDGIGALYGWYATAGGNWGRKYGSYNSGIGGAWVATGTESSFPIEAQMWQGYIPASAGASYELSAFFGASRCQVLITLIFMNSARGAIGDITDIYDGRTIGTPTPPNMPQLWCKGVAPAGTAYIYVLLRKTPTVAGQSQSFAWWNRIMLCDSSAFPLASRQSPTPWIDSGLDRMHGGGIEPLTVGTPQIANYAATDVLSTGVANFAVTYGNAAEQTFASLTYTAKVSGPALLSITGGLTNTYRSVSGGGGPYYFYGNSIRLAQSVTGISSPSIAFNDNSATANNAQILPISAEYVFDLVAGTTYTFSALIYNRTNYNDTLINSATLRMEAIKK